MTNKYCNLDGTATIREDYPKISAGFALVEADKEAEDARMQGHVDGAAEKHTAGQITNDPTGKTKLTGADIQSVVDQVEAELNAFIGVNVNAEIGDAHISTVKAKTFADLDGRFEEIEQDRVSDKADNATELALKATQENLDAEQSARLLEISVERVRIDNFVALPEGSTTGDAELIDGRVGADGYVYANLGSAIRGQVNNLKSDLNTLDTEIKNYLSHKAPLETPIGFGWDTHPLVDKVFTDYNGKYVYNFDVSQYDIASSGVTYYVDYVNGSETNDGLTPATALRTMATAYNKADCSCIMLAENIYVMGNTLSSITITKDISIKAMDGANVFITLHSGSTFTADLTYPNVYSATRGNCTRVLDMKYADKYENFLPYTVYSTVEQVASIAGSWGLIGGKLYVHTKDNRVPDADLLLLAAGNNIYAVGKPTIYLENITFIGGTSPLSVTNTATDTNPKIFAKNCNFFYSDSTNNDVVMLQGTELSIFQNCSAMYGRKDGFNYHAKNGTIPKAIEINCVGALCGTIEVSSDQGSTIHDGGTIIRIGCTYFGNYGSNVADDSVGTESWNVGCLAYDPKAPNEGQRANFYAYAGVSIWMDSCVGFGAYYNLYCADAYMYLRNNRFDGLLKLGVQPVTYY